MIKVVYDRTIPSVTMEGHAGSGEKGHDLVCAAVSILTYMLASIVQGAERGTQIQSAIAELNDGEALISCEPIGNYSYPIKLIFDTICTGFDILAHEYPDNVSYELVDEDKKGETL